MWAKENIKPLPVVQKKERSLFRVTIMSTLPGIHEITESSDSESRNGHSDKTLRRKNQSIEDDINKLFEAIDLGNSCRQFRGKSAMKRPLSPSQVSGIEISEPVSLKQALRGICISQASEMAAVRKRMLRPPTLPGVIQTGDNLASNSEPEISSANLSSNLVNRPNKSIHFKGKVHKGKTVHFKENVEFSRSSKGSSIGDYSEDSYLSGSSSSRSVLYRPHMSGDLRWEAISCAQKLHGSLSFRHFKMLKKIGGGDIGSVYLSELIGTNCRFAVKIMDNNFLISRKKMKRAQTEREILEILDHPFLPTLYAHFATDKFSCLVMEYCPGGDLHVLRQNQATRSFSEKAVRFYAAEVLLALEYLHMLGIVYRDLKPENILVREDGHIMLTDFDLSLKCPTVNPTLLKSTSPSLDHPKKNPTSCSTSGCIDPFCLQPSWQQLSCLTPIFLSKHTRKPKLELVETPLPQLVVEPTDARSNSFVGTHEYLAPEVVKGEGHGSPVDWWTFGILLYELLYGGTPFKGSSNEETVSNVVSKCLKFPRGPMVSGDARDLIRQLLRKEPGERMGAEKGAADIKRHPFFYGLNWALIRSGRPPGVPEVSSLGNEDAVCRSENGMGFEMF